jgi:hypothetical protein
MKEGRSSHWHTTLESIRRPSICNQTPGEAATKKGGRRHKLWFIIINQSWSVSIQMGVSGSIHLMSMEKPLMKEKPDTERASHSNFMRNMGHLKDNLVNTDLHVII